MNIKTSRLLNILIIAAIPFLIAGLFIYRYPFSGSMNHPAKALFLASSIIPAVASMALALCLQVFFSSISGPIGERFSVRIYEILGGIALLTTLWATLASTEVLLRIFYFGIWGQNVAGFSLISTSSIVIGISASFLIVGLSFREAWGLEAA